MRNLSVAICTIAMTAAFVFAADEPAYVHVRNKATPVYANEINPMYSQPVYAADPDMRLQVLQTTREHYQVKDQLGRSGWLPKSQTVAWAPSKKVWFDTIGLTGYLDNPQLVTIIDASGGSNDSIIIPDRSFKDWLFENIDQETAELRVREK